MQAIAPKAKLARVILTSCLAAISVVASISPAPVGAIDGNETVSIFAGSGGSVPSADGVYATIYTLTEPGSLASTGDGTTYITDSAGEAIRMVKDEIITTIVGATQTTGIDEPAVSAAVGIDSLESGPDQLPYFTNLYDDTVLRVDGAGILRRVAGNGNFGFSGDGGPAVDAQLNQPSGLAFGPNNSLYISDQGNNRIRRVGSDGIITTIAGTGTSGFSGDGGAATAAELDRPAKIAVDWHGNVYFFDTGNDRIRKIDGDGIITTIAGNNSGGIEYLQLGRDYQALEIDLKLVLQLDFDSSNQLHIAMYEQIFVLSNDSTITPVVTTGVGNNVTPIKSAVTGNIWGIAFNPEGNLLISTSGGGGLQDFVYRLQAHPNCRSGPADAQWQTANDTTRASVYRLYCAYFQRFPDQSGYDYWHDEFDSGTISLTGISDFFSASDEFNNTYGALSNEEFLDLLYGNVFQRAADAEGRAYWLNILDTGVLSKGGVVLQFSDSQEFRSVTGTP